MTTKRLKYLLIICIRSTIRSTVYDLRTRLLWQETQPQQVETNLSVLKKKRFLSMSSSEVMNECIDDQWFIKQ